MDIVKAEKARAMHRYRRIHRAAALSRCLLEILAALAILSWSSARLPVALRLSADLLHRLSVILVSPRFVFLLGNAIVLTLFAKSGHFSNSPSPSSSASTYFSSSGAAKSPTSATLTTTSAAAATASSSSSVVAVATNGGGGGGDLYDEFMRSTESHRYYSYFSTSPPPPIRLNQEELEEEAAAAVVYEDKAVCVETTYSPTRSTTRSSRSKGAPKDGFRRTRSVDLVAPRASVEKKKLSGGLRRSETDVLAQRKVVETKALEEWSEKNEEEEDSVEFRRTIEAFIAKQLQFIEREEESLLLASDSASASNVLVSAGGPGHPPKRR